MNSNETITSNTTRIVSENELKQYTDIIDSLQQKNYLQAFKLIQEINVNTYLVDECKSAKIYYVYLSEFQTTVECIEITISENECYGRIAVNHPEGAYQYENISCNLWRDRLFQKIITESSGICVKRSCSTEIQLCYNSDIGDTIMSILKTPILNMSSLKCEIIRSNLIREYKHIFKDMYDYVDYDILFKACQNICRRDPSRQNEMMQYLENKKDYHTFLEYILYDGVRNFSKTIFTVDFAITVEITAEIMSDFEHQKRQDMLWNLSGLIMSQLCQMRFSEAIKILDMLENINFFEYRGGTVRSPGHSTYLNFISESQCVEMYRDTAKKLKNISLSDFDVMTHCLALFNTFNSMGNNNIITSCNGFHNCWIQRTFIGFYQLLSFLNIPDLCCSNGPIVKLCINDWEPLFSKEIHIPTNSNLKKVLEKCLGCDCRPLDSDDQDIWEERIMYRQCLREKALLILNPDLCNTFQKLMFVLPPYAKENIKMVLLCRQMPESVMALVPIEMMFEIFRHLI
jgi:hypothetical protein